MPGVLLSICRAGVRNKAVKGGGGGEERREQNWRRVERDETWVSCSL